MRTNIYFLLTVVFLNTYSYSQKDNDILPVELIYFEAFVLSNGVLVRWGTATEVNNFGFELQRASTNLIFQTLDFIPGHGNSNSPKHYFYIDTTHPNYGLYYYRLKQIDIDGTIRFSDTISVNYYPLGINGFNQPDNNHFTVYNNYNSKELLISLPQFYSEEISVNVFSILGEKVKETFANPFSSNLNLSYNDFTNGVYILMLTSKNKIILTHKFLVLKN
jgi:hypothetical protein